MTCVILGDSISEGIGKRQMNYMPDLQSLADEDVTFINYARTGTTIQYLWNHMDDVFSMRPDVAVIMYGSVDAQIRADIWKNRRNLCAVIPKRYKGGGMLEPRAFHSRKRVRRFLEALDNAVRFAIKKYVLFTQGTTQWVSLEEFARLYHMVMERLTAEGISACLVSTVYIDDRYFLGSSREYEKFNSAIYDIAHEFHAEYVNLYTLMRDSVINGGWNEYFSYDHFHPNQEGYRMIAENIWQGIKRLKLFRQK